MQGCGVKGLKHSVRGGATLGIAVFGGGAGKGGVDFPVARHFLADEVFAEELVPAHDVHHLGLDSGDQVWVAALRIAHLGAGHLE